MCPLCIFRYKLDEVVLYAGKYVVCTVVAWIDVHAYPLPSLDKVEILCNLICSSPDIWRCHSAYHLVGDEGLGIAVAYRDNRMYVSCACIKDLVCKRLL